MTEQIRRSYHYFDRFAWVLLIAALALRVGVILLFYRTLDPHGGDSDFYIATATHLSRLGFISRQRVTSIGPAYSLFLAPFYLLIPDVHPLAQMVAVRLAQAITDTVTVGIVYLLACDLFGRRTGRVALAMQALDARYIFVAGSIATETLFITLLVGFAVVYYRAYSQNSWGLYRLAGLLLALSILVRPVAVLFVALVIPHLLFHPGHRAQARQGLAWLMTVMLLVALPWTLRSSFLAGELIPGANTAFSHFWLSTQKQGRDLSGQTFYEEKQETFGETYLNPTVSGSEYLGSGLSRITNSLGEWFNRVVGDTVKAYLQPYGTVLLVPESSPSLRQQVMEMLRGEVPITVILRQPGLFRRLLMYIWHFWGLAGGIIGAALVIRQRGWELMPLLGWILGTTAVVSMLLVEPRYLFPLMFVFTILAAHATVTLYSQKTAAPGS